MSGNVFGYAPDPSHLDTPSGCDRVLAEIGQQKSAVNLRLQQRSEAERAPYGEEIARLTVMHREVKCLRSRLIARDDAERWVRAFKCAVKNRVGAKEYQAILEATQKIIAASDALPNTARGPVMDYRSNGGAPKVRQ